MKAVNTVTLPIKAKKNFRRAFATFSSRTSTEAAESLPLTVSLSFCVVEAAASATSSTPSATSRTASRARREAERIAYTVLPAAFIVDATERALMARCRPSAR